MATRRPYHKRIPRTFDDRSGRTLRWVFRLGPAVVVLVGVMLVTGLQHGCDGRDPEVVDNGAAPADPSGSEGDEPAAPRRADPVTMVDVTVGHSTGHGNPLALSVDGPYTILDPDDRQLAAGNALERCSAWTTSTGRGGDGAWRHRVGRLVLDSRSHITLRPRRSGTLSVGGVRYHGALLLVPTGEDELVAVNRLPLEDYLAGVVASEMPRTFPAEALKAQAVAARSYACYRLAGGGRTLSGRHTLDQAYRGLSAEWPGARRAVEATRGEVLLVEGKLFKAFYHSTCGGVTVPADRIFPVVPIEPLSGGVECTWCQSSPKYRASAVLKHSDVGRALESRGIVGARVVDLRVTSSGSTREPQTVGIHYVKAGRRRIKTMKAVAFRMAVGPDKMYSAWIASVKPVRGGFKVTTRGYGHGVGMCQFGAAGQARQGRDYRRILETYYPGARIGRLSGSGDGDG